MAEAIVEFDYKAAEPDELSIKKGDIISEIHFKSGGWWEGTLAKNKQRGMFPDNFVKLVSDPDGKASTHQSSTGRKCKVLFNYKPVKEDELELQVGDVIDILSEVEEGWWRGKLKNRVGVFPSNFVAEIVENKETREASQRKHKTSFDESSKTSIVHTQEIKEHTSSAKSHGSVSISKVSSESLHDLPVLPPKPTKELCKAIFNYETQVEDELTLQEGDVITLITKEGQDPGWWKGELKGKIGVFPDNFVQIITPSEDVAKPDRPSKVVPTSSKPLSKSGTSTSISSISSISRKFSDTSKSDILKLEEKFNHPSVSKKPLVPPPPMKKPQRSSSDLAKSPTAPSLVSPKVMDISPTSQGRTGSLSMTTKQANFLSESVTSTGTNKWSTVTETSSDAADGALWSKHGSYTIKSENNVVSVNSGTPEPDLDMVGRAAMLTHPTASRVKAPKRRPPSAIIKDELKNGEEEEEVIETTNSTTVSSTVISHSSTVISSSTSSSSSIRTSTMMVNGDSDSHDKPSMKAPWVKELEFNQAKKSLQAGKTRVMIGGDAMTSSATTAVSPTAMSPENKPSVTGVTLRSHQGSTSNAPRPQSLVGSLRSSLIGSANSTDSNTVTISTKQFNELLEKVSKLELQFESHINALTRTVKELTSKLDDERLRRNIMQQELEKLTDLVTQV